MRIWKMSATQKIPLELSDMNNYEYIVASLPDISSEWKFGDEGPETYIEQILEQCTARDRELIEFLVSGFSAENLTPEFYRRATSHSNRFIREYFTFDLNLRNTKVKYLNKALGRPADKDVMSLSEEEMQFEEEQRAEAILAGKDILARERGLDDLMWEKISSLTVFDYFDIEAILGFIAKLQIIARWYRLDEKTGREMFRKLVDEIRGTNKGIDYACCKDKAESAEIIK